MSHGKAIGRYLELEIKMSTNSFSYGFVIVMDSLPDQTHSLHAASGRTEVCWCVVFDAFDEVLILEIQASAKLRYLDCPGFITRKQVDTIAFVVRLMRESGVCEADMKFRTIFTASLLEMIGRSCSASQLL